MPNKHLTPDKEIIKVAENEDRIVISKDSDFYQYNLIKGIPQRILFITTGNILNKELIRLLKLNFSLIANYFNSGSDLCTHQPNLTEKRTDISIRILPNSCTKVEKL